ncbi:MAG TPA: P1 family peptidase [Terracidiphilus sp.]
MVFVTFPTANPHANAEPGPKLVEVVSNERIRSLFFATVEAAQEAIVKAMVGAKAMSGVEGRTAIVLPHEPLQQVL